MAASFSKHPSSYRDPSGFLFHQDGVLYRQVNRSFKDDFDFFIQSGLYGGLTEKEQLVRHEVIHENLTQSPDHYSTLRPEPVPFITYPYEWSFNMLKEAALLTLDVAAEAMDHGMMLKDAPAANIQWHQGKMMLIDSLSFERYDERRPWVAYRQFCEHFFAPLAVMHYLKLPFQKLLLSTDGIPVAFAKALLPFKSRFNLHTYLHLHLHGSVAKNNKPSSDTRPFSKDKMKRLLKSLGEAIQNFSFDERSGTWSGYYEEAGKRESYLDHKKEIFSNWMSGHQYRVAIDLGSNEGVFSLMMAASDCVVISTDADHYSINQLYARTRKEGIKNILPLLVDITQPSPAIGVNNQEFPSFFSRVKGDLVLALALIHHLAVGKNIPFEKIATTFKNLGRDLIVEFIPKDDEKVTQMLLQKKDIYDWYTEENFLNCFSSHYSVTDSKKIAGTNRTIFLMKGI
jgi:hypothetical protein